MHKPIRIVANPQPIIVMFFQSEASVETQLIIVPSLTVSRLTLRFFLAVFGDIPQSDPCLKQIWFGVFSKITLQSFAVKANFNLEYVSSIFKLTVRLSKETPQTHMQPVAIVVFHLFYKTASDTAKT